MTDNSSNNNSMVKRVLAIIAIAVLVICAILTLVFALLTYFGVADLENAWKASAWTMVVLPIFIYAVLLIARILQNRKNK